MKQKTIFFLLFLLPALAGYSQKPVKVVPDSINAPDDYYLAVVPSGKIRGVLVLLPGFGQTAESIFPETKLPPLGYEQEVLVVSLAAGPKIYADEKVLNKINTALKDVKKRFSVAPDKFVLGGFSAGGTIALRYTQLCMEKPAEFPVKPAGVFTVDSPVDLVAIYRYFEREKEKDFSAIGVNEAVFVKDIMDKELGEMRHNLENYIAHSPFYAGQKIGNERFLKEVPVRVYHDVDVEWILKNRRRSLFDSNALESSEMISRLLLLGNSKAEFKTGRTGYRSTGERHPHSWSIVDEEELMNWMKKLIQI